MADVADLAADVAVSVAVVDATADTAVAAVAEGVIAVAIGASSSNQFGRVSNSF